MDPEANPEATLPVDPSQPAGHNYIRYGYILAEILGFLSIVCSAIANFLSGTDFGGSPETTRRINLAAGIMAVVGGMGLTKVSSELYRFGSRRKHRYKLRRLILSRNLSLQSE